MRVLIEPGSSGNVLATIAIGEAYYEAWQQYALPGWESYCRRHDLGLVAFDDDLISTSAKTWKKATWQKMLIAETVEASGLKVGSICYLDTDILIGPYAPNIFAEYDPRTIGLVSLRRRLPFPYDEVLRRLAFLRHTFYDRSYPLDSALFMSLEQLYQHHELPVQDDEACMGLIVFTPQHHASLMRGWFDKYDRDVQSITGGGDQTHINFEIQNWGSVTWLDYRFQAIWAFEMAWRYPFLYEATGNNDGLIRSCIEAALTQNHFLHFAGSWHESAMWKRGKVFDGAKSDDLVDRYRNYLKMPVTGIPAGLIKPKN